MTYADTVDDLIAAVMDNTHGREGVLDRKAAEKSVLEVLEQAMAAEIHRVGNAQSLGNINVHGFAFIDDAKGVRCVIRINRTKVAVTAGSIVTGADLREAFNTRPTDDLWMNGVGDDDQLIEPDLTMALRGGMRFYTAPRLINGG